MTERDYPVIISYANCGYKKFADNLIKNLSIKLKNHRVHFYCLDTEIYEYFINKENNKLNITFELWNCNISSNFEEYNSSKYISLTHQKVQILKKCLDLYNFIHFIDCDVVCVNEPDSEMYNKYKEYDVMFQYDCGLPHPLYHPWTCTGNMTIRNSSGTQSFLNILETYQNNYPFKNDQECLYEYFNHHNIADVRNTCDFKCNVYPMEQYTNGWLIKTDSLALDNTYFFHANHVIGEESKINLLKKINEWYI